MLKLVTGRRFFHALYLAVFVGAVLLARRKFHESFGRNECAMSHMWRQIMLMDVGFRENNHYNLFLYGEGYYARNFINSQHVDGIPIIFVPGNAGSGRQVRSLASVLQNKTESRNTRFHFDVFGVDFNEEFSGLHSTYLHEHTKFLRKAILHVWKMYDKPPTGIILYGHSLGGIVSQLVLDDPEIRPKISMVFALASPFKEPPYPIDENFVAIWQRLYEIGSPVPIISIDGGLRDELIAPEWTYAPFALHASTTEIDDVWLETDHQCIVWCNQLVRQNTRVLFDYARAPTKFATNYLEIFTAHFKSPHQYTKLTVATENSSFVSANECRPKCPETGVLKLDSSSDESKFVVAVTARFAPQFSLNGECVGEFHLCGPEKICSFYRHEGSDAPILGLKGSDVWVLPDSIIANPVELHFLGAKLFESDFVGLQIIPLKFDHPLFVYRLEIRTNNKIPNIIYVSNKSKRLAKIAKSALLQKLVVNLVDFEDANSKLYLFGAEETHVEVSSQIDPLNSAIKILRFARIFLIFSITLFYFTYSLTKILVRHPMVASLLAVTIASRFWNADTVLTLIVASFNLVMHLLILSINGLVEPVFCFFNKRIPTLGLKTLTTVYLLMLAGSLFTHPFPFTLLAALSVACSFPQFANLRIWIELFLFLQFPSAFEFGFGVRKYQQLVYPLSPFTLSSALFIFDCFVILMSKKLDGRYRLIELTSLIEFGLIASKLYFSPHRHFLTTLDSLSLFCALAVLIDFRLLGRRPN